MIICVAVFEPSANSVHGSHEITRTMHTCDLVASSSAPHVDKSKHRALMYLSFDSMISNRNYFT